MGQRKCAKPCPPFAVSRQEILAFFDFLPTRFPKGFGEGKNNRTKAVTSRAQFYEDVYSIGEQAGVVGFAFWDLGSDIRGNSYQVNPDTPAVWQVILRYAPDKPTAASTVV